MEWKTSAAAEHLLRFSPDRREGPDRRGGDGMGPQQLFHPDHVVPAVELIAALGKFPHQPVAQMGVEPQAVPGQVFVVGFRHGNAGVQVQNALHPQNFFQGAVQPLPQTLVAAAVGEVNGGLRRPAVSGPGVEGTGVGVAHNGAVFHRCQVRVLFQRMPDPSGELLQRGHLVLKGDGGVPDVIGIKLQQGRSVLWARDTDGNFRHRIASLEMFPYLFTTWTLRWS